MYLSHLSSGFSLLKLFWVNLQFVTFVHQLFHFFPLQHKTNFGVPLSWQVPSLLLLCDHLPPILSFDFLPIGYAITHLIGSHIKFQGVKDLIDTFFNRAIFL